jgi:predicted transposase YdaD
LEVLSLSDKISEYEKCTLIDMSKKVLDNIAAKYANVRKEVTSVMGGKVLDYEAKDILQSGIRQGKMEGLLEGKIEGLLEGKQETLLELVHDGLLSIDEAARRLKMSKEEVEKLSANYTPDQENQ